MNTVNSHTLHLKGSRKSQVVFGFLFIFLLATMFLGILFGPATSLYQSFQNLFSDSAEILHHLIYQIRLPRVILGLIAGGGLAITGAALQSLFNNPLADSGLIGISSGAMLGVIVAILFGKVIPGLGWIVDHYPNAVLPLSASIGAFALGLLVYRLSLNHGKVSVTTMLLAGIAINAFAGAASGLMISMVNDEQLRTITFWSMGSLNGASWTSLLLLFSLVSLGSFLLLKHAPELDALGLGEREAIYLGVDTDKVKKRVLILSALICGPIVSSVGLIGFVGLIVPHILRMFVGAKIKPLMICSLLLGGIFLILADVISKNVIAPSELPIGIITALIGTPFFTYLLIKQKGGK